VRAPRVHITIDEIVLRGMPEEPREACLQAIRSELGRRFSDARFVGSLHPASIANAGQVVQTAPTSAQSAATSIASGVVAALGSEA